MKIAEIIDRNTIFVYDLSQFDINAILQCGQVFRYTIDDNGAQVIAGSNHAKITTESDHAIIKSNDSNFFFNYFDLATDYNAIKQKFAEHEKLREPIKAGGGIRIIRGEFVETVLSFVISANNNIKRFTKTLNLICEEYGARLANGDFSFPTLGQLERATEQDFKRLGCGYRSAYLVKTIKQLADEEYSYEALCALSPNSLHKELVALCGVGDKVARCVMLFCFHRLEIFPVDTWMEKAFDAFFDESSNQHSKDLTKKQPNSIISVNSSPMKKAEYLTGIFGEYAGVAQQYMFYYLQHLKKQF